MKCFNSWHKLWYVYLFLRSDDIFINSICQLVCQGFTEDQKRRVGVGCPVEGNGGGGLFSSIVKLVAPGEGGKPLVDPSTIEGKNFADIWFEYLLEEVSKGK